MMNQNDIQNLLYLVSAIGFIVGIKRLSHPRTARSGNFLASLGMLVAIIATLTSGANFDWQLIALGVGIGSILGIIFAVRVEMTQMPQMVAIFNGLGGAASAFVASSEYFSGSDSSFTIMSISVLIGTLTFSGSFIAFGKLQGFISGRAITFTGQQAINALIFGSMLALLSAYNFNLLPSLSLIHI